MSIHPVVARPHRRDYVTAPHPAVLAPRFATTSSAIAVYTSEQFRGSQIIIWRRHMRRSCRSSPTGRASRTC